MKCRIRMRADKALKWKGLPGLKMSLSAHSLFCRVYVSGFWVWRRTTERMWPITTGDTPSTPPSACSRCSSRGGYRSVQQVRLSWFSDSWLFKKWFLTHTVDMLYSIILVLMDPSSKVYQLLSIFRAAIGAIGDCSTLWTTECTYNKRVSCLCIQTHSDIQNWGACKWKASSSFWTIKPLR